MTYAAWAARWPQAAAELMVALVPDVPAVSGVPGSEARAQSEIRLEAPTRDCMLFRNNSGALQDKDGRWIRYGLGHESSVTIRHFKTSDLIGWRRLLVTPAMVGRTVAQFLAREVKRPGWRMLPSDADAQAQAVFLALVARDGGDAAFATGVGTL